MASILDIGLLSFLTPLFVLVFVYLILYAVFEKFTIFGDKSNIHALVAFILALLFVLVANLRDLLTLVVPMVVLFFIVLIVVLMGIMFLGIKQEDITSYVKATPAVTVTIIVIVIVLFIFGIGSIFPELVGYPTASETGLGAEIRRTIFNPKMLGVLFILVVASFLVRTVGFKK